MSSIDAKVAKVAKVELRHLDPPRNTCKGPEEVVGLVPRSWRAFSCGVCMFSQHLRGFSPGDPQSKKTIKQFSRLISSLHT